VKLIGIKQGTLHADFEECLAFLMLILTSNLNIQLVKKPKNI
jgi:hypothetical protein